MAVLEIVRRLDYGVLSGQRCLIFCLASILIDHLGLRRYFYAGHCTWMVDSVGSTAHWLKRTCSRPFGFIDSTSYWRTEFGELGLVLSEVGGDEL